MTDAENLGKILLQGLPTREQWPQFKAEVEAAQAAEQLNVKLATLESLTRELQFAIRARHNSKQWVMIQGIVDRMRKAIEP